MGLTIHYDLQTGLSWPDDVRTLVESVRDVARDLPFEKVGELLEFEGKDADFEHDSGQEEERWFKIQAGNFVVSGDEHYRVNPVHIIGFSTFPGDGCEPANFGFCRYPGFIELEDAVTGPRQLATGLDRWCWRSFCKTQYASDPACGGVPNFLRCHLCVVKLLDFMRSTNLVTVEVHDEGGYWDHRDLGKLACEVGNWNEIIAAFAGQFKDKAGQEGVQLASAISGFANFAHLEAKGLERLRKLRAQADADPLN